MFQKIEADGGDHGGFMDHLDPNVKVEVMGHDHESKNTHHNHKAVADDFFGQFEWADWDSMKTQVQQVIGGDSSPWASVELVLSGKSKKGKLFNHECCLIVHFHDNEKIDNAHAYLDSKHLDDHHSHHRNN